MSGVDEPLTLRVEHLPRPGPSVLSRSRSQRLHSVDMYAAAPWVEVNSILNFQRRLLSLPRLGPVPEDYSSGGLVYIYSRLFFEFLASHGHPKRVSWTGQSDSFQRHNHVSYPVVVLPGILWTCSSLVPQSYVPKLLFLPSSITVDTCFSAGSPPGFEA